MKRVISVFIVFFYVLIFTTCDLINPAAIDKIIQTSYRDNPADNDFWEVLLDFDGAHRGNPVIFTVGGKGYYGLGDDFEGSFQKDFWMYDSVSRQWTQKNDFTGTGRRGCVSFLIDGDVYIIGGSDSAGDVWIDSKECWKYSIANGAWSRIADLPAFDRDGEQYDVYWNWPVSATAANGKGWLLINDRGILMYDPVSDSWSEDSTEWLEYGEYIPMYIGDLSYHLIKEDTHASGLPFGLFSYNVTSRVKTEIKRYAAENFSFEGQIYTFVLSDRIYIFTQNCGTGEDSLISYPANSAGGIDDGLGHGNPEAGRWIEDGVNGNYFPIIFHDSVHFLLPDGNFYRYKT